MALSVWRTCDSYRVGQKVTVVLQVVTSPIVGQFKEIPNRIPIPLPRDVPHFLTRNLYGSTDQIRYVRTAHLHTIFKHSNDYDQGRPQKISQRGQASETMDGAQVTLGRPWGDAKCRSAEVLGSEG